MFIWEEGLQREAESEESFIYWFTSPNDCNGRRWASLNLGPRSSFWVSPEGVSAQEPGPSSASFPGHERGARQEVVQPGLELLLNWDASVTGEGLAYHVIVLAPETELLKRLFERVTERVSK